MTSRPTFDTDATEPEGIPLPVDANTTDPAIDTNATDPGLERPWVNVGAMPIPIELETDNEALRTLFANLRPPPAPTVDLATTAGEDSASYSATMSVPAPQKPAVANDLVVVDVTLEMPVPPRHIPDPSTLETTVVPRRPASTSAKRTAIPISVLGIAIGFALVTSAVGIASLIARPVRAHVEIAPTATDATPRAVAPTPSSPPTPACVASAVPAAPSTTTTAGRPRPLAKPAHPAPAASSSRAAARAAFVFGDDP